MSKRSGFAIRISAFIEADATNAEQIGHALMVIGGLANEMKRLGFMDAECSPRFMLSRKVPDEPKAETGDDLDAGLKSAGLDRRKA